MKNLMTRIGLIAAMTGLLLSPTQTLAKNNEAIKVYLNGNQMNFRTAPVIEKGTTLVPFKVLFEALGMRVTWNQKLNEVVGEGNGQTIKLRIGLQFALVNGKDVSLDSAPKVVNGTTMIPLRFVSESTGSKVRWDKRAQSIYVTTLEDTSDSDQEKVYYNSLGYKYIGEISNNRPNGLGKQFAPDGELIYEGNFEDGLKSGKGTYYSKDVTYVGDFKNDKPNGIGTFTFSNGSSFVGESEDGKIGSYGTFILTDGSKYVGSFKDQIFDGEGTMYSPSGEIVGQGAFKNGKLVDDKSAEKNGDSVDSADSSLVVLNDLKSKFSVISINGTDIHFTYQHLNYGEAGDILISALINPADYSDYRNLVIKNGVEVQSELQKIAEELVSSAKRNGYKGSFMSASYQDRFQTFPSSYKPSEMSVNNDGSITVTHSIFTIYNGILTIK
ncbi:stalk domain-containing protein [Paenibacillus sp. FSL H8-0079]|uniref:stalk domain-containing protein n=1 Tax=Paenibacillus sp. FSL H8-0079 TaxID=2921375 RepID=UPI0030EF906B